MVFKKQNSKKEEQVSDDEDEPKEVPVSVKMQFSGKKNDDIGTPAELLKQIKKQFLQQDEEFFDPCPLGGNLGLSDPLDYPRSYRTSNRNRRNKWFRNRMESKKFCKSSIFQYCSMVI
jgi:hypothetical protein